MLPVIVASVILVLAAFAMFGLRILILKNGSFRGTCAGNSSFLKKEGVVCGVCGKDDKESPTSKIPA
jgi:hypothetical protein